MTYKFKEFEEKDIDKSIYLFREIYPEKKGISEFIRWKYFNNPYKKKTKSHIVLDDNLIVGFRGWFPSVYTNGLENLNVGFASDAFIHPDHRRKGIFSNLMDYSLYSNKKLGTHFFCSLSISIATSNFYLKNKGSIFSSKLNTDNKQFPVISSQRFFLPKFSRSLFKSNFRPKYGEKFKKKGFEMSSIPKPKDMSELAKISHGSKFNLKKEESFFNWRFSSSTDYLFFYYNVGDKLLAYIVVSLKKSFFAQIVDYAYSSISSFNNLLIFTNLMIRDRLLIIWGYSKPLHFINNLVKLGFISIEKMHYLYSNFLNLEYTSPVIMSYDGQKNRELYFGNKDLAKLVNWDFNQIDNDST